MRFNPVFSICLGVIASFILHLITQSLFFYGWFQGVIAIFSYMFGGFIAVFYAREKKIQYALYEGIFIMLIITLQALGASSDVSIIFVVYYSLFVILLAILGGMIVLIRDKDYNGFSPALAITGGSIIGYSCMFLLNSIIGYNVGSNYSLKVIVFVFGVISLVIGGYSSTFLAEEKKLRYGIFTGIIITILGLLGLQTSLYKPPTIHGIAILLYSISAIIGSYLAIIATKHQQKT